LIFLAQGLRGPKAFDPPASLPAGFFFGGPGRAGYWPAWLFTSANASAPVVSDEARGHAVRGPQMKKPRRRQTPRGFASILSAAAD